MKVVDHPESVIPAAQALIEEARRRQRRRRVWIAGVLLLSLVLGVSGYALSAKHAGPGPVTTGPGPSETVPPSSPPTTLLGPATEYQLTGPSGVAVDSADDIFLTDADEVLRVDRATGQIGVVAGSAVVTCCYSFSGDGGLATHAQLANPSDVALAPNGDLYVLDSGPRIRKISAATGIITTVAGNGQPGSSGDGGRATRARLDASSIAVAPNGDLYIADGGNNKVRRVSGATGIITTVAGDGRTGSAGDGGPALRAELDRTGGVALDSRGNVFVATGARIREISTSTGVIRTVFGPVPNVNAGRPTGLALGRGGILYFTDGGKVLSLDTRTRHLAVIAGTGARTVQEAGATAGDGGPATRATFGLPVGVTVDAEGNVYVADFFNNSIRFIDHATGVIRTVVGQIPQTPAHCC